MATNGGATGANAFGRPTRRKLIKPPPPSAVGRRNRVTRCAKPTQNVFDDVCDTTWQRRRRVIETPHRGTARGPPWAIALRRYLSNSLDDGSANTILSSGSFGSSSTQWIPIGLASQSRRRKSDPSPVSPWHGGGRAAPQSKREPRERPNESLFRYRHRPTPLLFDGTNVATFSASTIPDKDRRTQKKAMMMMERTTDATHTPTHTLRARENR